MYYAQLAKTDAAHEVLKTKNHYCKCFKDMFNQFNEDFVLIDMKGVDINTGHKV